MNKLKLMTIIGTRPEIIRLSSVIKSCDTYFDHVLVHTGQNWDHALSQVFFDDFGLRQPDHFLDCAGANVGETMGAIIAKSYEIMVSERPDALLVLGDTNSALSAISAKRLKIPIFHMEAGNRCWDWNVPEMTNRTIVDHIADINLPYTENSRRYLLSEGVDGKTIFVTGSPMREVLRDMQSKIDASTVLEELGLEPKRYIVLSAHREENIDDEAAFTSLMEAVNHIAETYQMPIVYSAHPRSRKFIESRGFEFDPLVRVLQPFSFTDYNKLQMNSYCVLSDSGTLSEESAILDFPGVLIRTSTERPEAIDAGTVVIGGITGPDIEQALELAVAMSDAQEEVGSVADYGDTCVSTKVVKVIQGYANIVDITTWRKNMYA
ncbi:MAG: UDP-N-acetylglucosamine 2-epimerase (non-hydrolyzing) [Actinomycetota bacterium]|nr:MAG: UDP-N-acetylglucosamine [Actinomycetota bacterium]MDO8949072.1 UDP-N-acetylglucosamine 2-epimerase (non-hydrolyzing) [Actinomycetota bacterium]MDP3630585.1 UDP-N-acetylglucosamine 2-epimerase (non-hydrolyzing) [Actinomycetota bacterium]